MLLLQLRLRCSGTAGGVLEARLRKQHHGTEDLEELPWAHLEHEDEESWALLEVLGLRSWTDPWQESALPADC